MQPIQLHNADGTVSFLPHRLNRQPVIVRGLTADELWVCTGLSASMGLITGIPLAWLVSSIAVAPSLMMIAITVGIFMGGGVLRRHKRGRPDTWLYRQFQWRLAQHYPEISASLGFEPLITRSGYWTTHRGGV